MLRHMRLASWDKSRDEAIKLSTSPSVNIQDLNRNMRVLIVAMVGAIASVREQKMFAKTIFPKIFWDLQKTETAAPTLIDIIHHN